MAVVSHKYRYIYFGPWGTGSTSVITALCTRAAGVLLPEADVRDDRGALLCPSKHTKPEELRRANLLPPTVLDACFKFSCVRNPFDFYYSEWLRSRTKWARLSDQDWTQGRKGDSIAAASRLSFPDWVAWELSGAYEASRQNRLFWPWSEGVDHLMRFENLSADFAAVMERLGVPGPVELVHENATAERFAHGAKKDYRDAYDDASRRLLATVYQDELARHGYEF